MTDHPLAPAHVNGIVLNIVNVNMRKKSPRQRWKEWKYKNERGGQAQESCGYTTHGTSTGRRGRVVPFNDSSEYETTRTLARTSLTLAPTMVYIHL